MNAYITLIYVFLSATAYASAFIFNDILWFAIFLFPLPLFYAAIYSSISFVHGYLFGAISIGLILYDTLLTTINMAAPCGGYMRIIPALMLIFYLPLYAGIFFEITRTWVKFCRPSPSAILAGWIVTLTAYFYCMDQYSFWIFDRKEGCFLLHPALTLTDNPFGLYLASIVGKVGVTIFILLPATSFMFSRIHTFRCLSISTLSFSLLIIGCLTLYQPSITQKPIWLDELVHVPLIFSSQDSVAKITRKIKRICSYSLDCYPRARCFLFPESSIYNPQFFTDTDTLQQFSKQEIGKKVTIVCGSFRNTHEATYNTCFVIHNGTKLSYHDKKHLMPLIERIPSWFNAECIVKHYFPTKTPLWYGQNTNPLITLTNRLEAVPYLCSELFCHEHPIDTHRHQPIVALCNDRWFSYAYTKKLMIASAKLKAALWNRPIIYISYLVGLFIDPQGAVYPLLSYRD